MVFLPNYQWIAGVGGPKSKAVCRRGVPTVAMFCKSMFAIPLFIEALKFMSQLDRVRPILWFRGSVVFVIVVMILAGCGGNTQSADSEEQAEERYHMGAPLEDSTYALIVTSEYGGDTLTTDEFQGRLQSFVMRVGRPLDPTQLRQVRQGIAEEFIQRHLLRSEAEQLNLEADEAAVDQQIDQIIMQNRLESREALATIVAEQGMTMDSLRNLIKGELAMQMVQERMEEGVEEPTESEIETFREEQAEEVRAQHILFSVADPGQEDSVIERANMVLDSAKAGVDFAVLARRHSEGPSSVEGGDLGFFSKNAMVTPFSEAAFALSDSGDVAPELVKTQFGYHIIRLTGRRTAELMDSTQARTMLMQERRREAVEDGYQALRQKAVIHVNPDIIDADLNASGAG